jgi:quercetin dioxygenase-like cupin family protein
MKNLVGNVADGEPKTAESLINTELYELVTQEKYGSNFSFNLLKISPGGSVVRQSHPEQHAIYIAEGGCRILLGDSWIDVNKGDYGYIPADFVHSFAVPADGQLTEVLILKI